MVFFFIFAQTFKAQQGGSINQVITMGADHRRAGQWIFRVWFARSAGAGLGILRPIQSSAIHGRADPGASLVTGLLAYLFSRLILFCSHYIYACRFRRRLLSLLCILSIGLMAFRGLGLVIASVVNSMQESQMVIQLLYLPMPVSERGDFSGCGDADVAATGGPVPAGFLPLTSLQACS